MRCVRIENPSFLDDIECDVSLVYIYDDAIFYYLSEITPSYLLHLANVEIVGDQLTELDIELIENDIYFYRSEIYLHCYVVNEMKSVEAIIPETVTENENCTSEFLINSAVEYYRQNNYC